MGIFKTNKSGYYFSREMTIPKKSLCITICHAECLELFTTSTWGITKKDLTFNRYTRCLLCLTAGHFSWKYPAILGSNELNFMVEIKLIMMPSISWNATHNSFLKGWDMSGSCNGICVGFGRKVSLKSNPSTVGLWKLSQSFTTLRALQVVPTSPHYVGISITRELPGVARVRKSNE